jgi:AcrR family transcriptional regulator
MGYRQVAVDQTRARIVEAARELLAAKDNISGFTMEAVARQAGVARMTVYYQFASKAGLLEALCDSLAARGGIERLAEAFARPEPLDALAEFIAVFTRFLDNERQVIRRLHGLAALDGDFEKVLQARAERRREGLRIILKRIAERHGRPRRRDFDEAVTLLWTLTSFETFYSLAGPGRKFEEVIPLVQQLARAALRLDKE